VRSLEIDGTLSHEARDTPAQEMERISREIMNQLQEARSQEVGYRLAYDPDTRTDDVSIKGQWIPIVMRRSGSFEAHRFITYIPRSDAPYLLMWHLNDGNQAIRYRFY